MKNGDLRLCVITNVPSKPRYYSVPSVEVALLLKNVISNEHLLCENDIISNMIYLEEYNKEYLNEEYEDCDGWVEWQDEDGYDLEYYKLEDFKLILEDY